jgi:hypothetical protein
MNETQWIKSLDRDVVEMPALDVSQRVLRSLRTADAAQQSELVLPVAAFISAVLGVTACVVAVPFWWAATDPFIGLGNALQMVLQ